jgi:4,5-dihydroxyphthalate decarboxylase
MCNAFEHAKTMAMKRMQNPRIVPLVFYRDAWEEQEEIFGKDPWEYGLTDRNRYTLDVLVNYAFDQGLIKRKPPLDELFIGSLENRQRGI